MLRVLSFIMMLMIFALDLNATSMHDLFQALKKQPISKVDEEVAKIAKVTQQKVDAIYYPKVNLFGSYTHYNSPTNLRPLDPLATARLNASKTALPFSNTIEKIGVKATMPIFIKELASLSKKAKHMAKSAKLKKRLNFFQNEAIIVTSNASLQYLDSLLRALKTTRKSLLKTRSDLVVAVDSGRTPAIALKGLRISARRSIRSPTVWAAA